MGGAKHALMKHQEKVAFSVSILIDAETLQQCDICDSEVIADSDDLQAAYRLANSRWDDGKYDYSKTFRSRREMTDCIKQAYGSNCGDECAHCAHMMAD